MGRKKRNLNILTAVLLPVIACVVLCGILFAVYRVCNRLSVTNQLLTGQNEKLRAEVDEIQAAWDAERAEAETDRSFDYLAIGNSITRHPVMDDWWWGDWGMAASTEENDYFHLVRERIALQYGEFTAEALNFRVWEDPFYERADTLPYLEGYLNERLDLVTVMLGENVLRPEGATDEEYFLQMERDFTALVTHIREKAPEAKIIVVGCFWADDVLDSAKQKVCEEQGVIYLPLQEIQGEEWRIGQGSVVKGGDGNDHVVEDMGVAQHPNDEAMRYIAEQIAANVPGL